MTFTLHLGDCLATMRAMPDASVDSIVTDPPYGLEFMGKEWDGADGFRRSLNANDAGRESTFGRMSKRAPEYRAGKLFQEWCEAWATEALRVLKPGGHLLAFSGSRTYHRMTCAIEDAGFEVRDQIMWVYGQGFPKSNNMDNLRGKKICGCSTDALPYTHDDTEPQTERDLHSLLNADVSAPVDSSEGRGQVLQPSLSEQVAPAAERGELRPGQDGRSESCMEGRGDDVQAEGQLQGHSVRASAGAAAADGTEGRLHNGASDGDGPVVRLSADADGSGAPHRPRSNKQPAQQSGTVAGQPQPQTGGAWPICTGCALPVVPQGLGTSLKPAHEPICVARKPLIGTVAANVLAHGTGAINIDGCRIEGGERPLRESDRRNGANGTYGDGLGGSRAVGNTQAGRWPANLIHDGSDEVVALFPVTKPAQGGRHSGRKGTRDEVGGYGFERVEINRPTDDGGSAARFFYCAKTSKADRGAENIHPTVKPTDLMAYLCRLVTPPGGIVLDPFMGSGSTGKAAMREGFHFIGIDMTPEYVEIARARVAAEMDKRQPIAAPAPAQFDLLAAL